MKSEIYEMDCCQGLSMHQEEKQPPHIKMFRFLSIFHPELSLVKRLELAEECRPKHKSGYVGGWD